MLPCRPGLPARPTNVRWSAACTAPSKLAIAAVAPAAASAGLDACGRRPVIPGARKIIVAKICAPADAGACRPAHSNGWGCDPHLARMPPLTVVSVGAAFLWQLGHRGGRIGAGGRRRSQVSLRCCAAPHSTPLHHSCMPPHPHSTHHSYHTLTPPMHARDAHGGGGGNQSPPPHGPSTCPTIPTHPPPHGNTHALHVHIHTATHALSHPPLAGTV